jgi:hypothetical protein
MNSVILYLSMLIAIPAEHMDYYERYADEYGITLEQALERHIIHKVGFPGLYDVKDTRVFEEDIIEHPFYGPMTPVK